MRVWAACAALVLLPVAACSPANVAQKNKTGDTVLNWYMPPDRVDARALASSCSLASSGDYEMVVRELPADAQTSRSELIRRLSAKDPSIDLISLDTEFTAEFSAAKLLAPIPDDLEPAFVKDIFPAALEASSYDGELVSVPWWFDPQLLWFRGTVAERAGLDMTKPVLWDDLIEGARRVGTTIEIEDPSGTGLGEWVTGLVSAAGGKVVSGSGRNATVGIDSAAGQDAAGVIQHYAESEVGSGPSVDALKSFAGSRGGFLVASTSVISDPAVAAIAAGMHWAPWPTIDTGGTSIAPLSGRGLAVSLYSPSSELAFKAIKCLTTAPTMEALMVSSGHSSARATTYDAEEFTTAYPMAQVARQGVEGGASVPATPYWPQISGGIAATWLPLSAVTAVQTPRNSQRVVEALLAGKLP